jgi:acylphosphatase
MTDTRQVRVMISGKVQGVWFRAWTVEQAQSLGLTGWVRNRRDGGVEAVFAGPPERVEEMLARCGEGPPMAEVARVEAEDDASELMPGFHQAPDV